MSLPQNHLEIYIKARLFIVIKFFLKRRYPVFFYKGNKSWIECCYLICSKFFSHSSNFPLQWLVWLVEWQRRINFVLKWRQSALNFDCILTDWRLKIWRWRTLPEPERQTYSVIEHRPQNWRQFWMMVFKL